MPISMRLPMTADFRLADPFADEAAAVEICIDMPPDSAEPAADAAPDVAPGAADDTAAVLPEDIQRLQQAAPRPTLAFVPTDTLAGSQWHLTRLGNLQKIWDEYTGLGVHVGIYDDGVQFTHHDLNANYDATRQLVISGKTYSGINVGNNGHGTSVAGIIAAENDGVGTIGIAFRASLTGVNIFDDTSALSINATNPSGFENALRLGTVFDVINDSWGSEPFFDATQNLNDPSSFDAVTAASFNYLLANGRPFTTAGGQALKLGTNVVQAAGNESRNSNAEGINASRVTITVAAVDDQGVADYYSNHGACVLIAAPGGGGNDRGMVTTDLLGADGDNSTSNPTSDDYTDTFGGTSAATPNCTAVIALMLQANPGLGWRDVQNILAASARQTGSALDATVAGATESGLWAINKADDWNGGGMHVNASYGYGHLDAYNAVRMAEVWTLFGAAQTSANEQSFTQAINLGGTKTISESQTPTTVSFTINSSLIIEHIDLTLTISHKYFTDVRCDLVSAEGTRINLIDGTAGDDTTSDTPLTWTFGIDSLRGEVSAGGWALELRDVHAGTKGTLGANLSFTAYGTTPGSDTVYHYTDELGLLSNLAGQSSRLTLNDSNGGNDWVDAAAVTTASTIALQGGASSTIAGRTVTTAAGIENAVTGDGDDGITGGAENNTLYGMRGNDAISGGAGNDTLSGGVGNDLLDGGTGTDTALFGGTQGQSRIGLRDGACIVSGPDGLDRLTNIELLKFGSAAAVSIATLQSGGTIDELAYVAQAGNGIYVLPDLYSGPVAGLKYQVLGSAAGEAALGTGQNDFFNLLGGDDAVDGGAGNDVLDGGIGSNFLTGGAGIDTFFLDGRGGTTTWSTITDWQAGEQLSVFGWKPGASRVLWLASDGAVGYKGVTMHADLDGNGVIDTSVTWSGKTQADLPTPLQQTDLLWFT